MYVGDEGNSTIFKVDIASKAVSILVQNSPIKAPDRMLIGDGRALTGFDPIVSEQNAEPTQTCCNGSVWRVDLEISFGGASFAGDLFVLDPVATPGTPRNIWRVGSSGAISQFFAFPIQDPAAMKFGPGGIFGTNLYVLMDGGDLLEISANGTAVVVARGVPVALGWTDIAFSPSGDRLFVVANNGIFEIVPLPPPIATPTLDQWALTALVVLLCVLALRSPRLQVRS